MHPITAITLAWRPWCLLAFNFVAWIDAVFAQRAKCLIELEKTIALMGGAGAEGAVLQQAGVRRRVLCFSDTGVVFKQHRRCRCRESKP